MLHVVFDLDDTPFFTRDAVRKAYVRAGVIMPDDMWGKPWRFWTTAEVHARKIREYEKMIHDDELIPATPAMTVMRELAQTGHHVYLLTGASKMTSQRLLMREGVHPRELTGMQFNCSSLDKAKHLRNLLVVAPSVVYIDDDEEFAQHAPAGVTFVHYIGQSKARLIKDITWTPSS